MDKTKIWLIGATLAMVAIVAGAWFLGIQPQLTVINAANDQRASVESTNTQYEATLAKLKSDYTKLPELKSDLAELASSVPSGTEIPVFVDELNALYPSAGVSFVDLTVDDAQAYKPVVVAPAAADASTAATSGSAASSTPSPTPTPTPTPTQPASAGAAAPVIPAATSPLVTADNFAALPVSITVRGPYSNALQFVSGLQSGKRLFLVTGISTTATTVQGAPAGSVDAKISGYIYSIVKPAVQPVAAKK